MCAQMVNVLAKVDYVADIAVNSIQVIQQI